MTEEKNEKVGREYCYCTQCSEGELFRIIKDFNHKNYKVICSNCGEIIGDFYEINY